MKIFKNLILFTVAFIFLQLFLCFFYLLLSLPHLLYLEFLTEYAAPPLYDYTSTSQPAGFVSGFVHAYFSIAAFILSLFFDSIEIYSANNSGLTYHLGFVMGVILNGAIVYTDKIEKSQKKKAAETGKENMVSKILTSGISLLTLLLFFATPFLLYFFYATSVEVTMINDAHVTGFWGGISDGVMFFINMVKGYYNDSFQVYDLMNKGGIYDLGFIIGRYVPFITGYLFYGIFTIVIVLLISVFNKK